MSDIEKLTPAERALQLGKPQGEIGIAIGEALNRTNGQVIAAAYEHLKLQPQMRLLEIGFGNGHTARSLFSRYAGLHYTGIDISDTMVEEALRFNAAEVSTRQAEFKCASVEHMPFANASFDRAVAVNVIYFLSDPVPALREVRRVLRPTGVAIIAGVDPASVASISYAKAELGFHARDGAELAELHSRAGFRKVDVLPYEETTTRPDGSSWQRKYNFVVGRP